MSRKYDLVTNTARVILGCPVNAEFLETRLGHNSVVSCVDGTIPEGLYLILDAMFKID